LSCVFIECVILSTSKENYFNYYVEQKNYKQMKNLITRIEKETGVQNLGLMSWSKIVNEVVLPKMAGPKETRWNINDMFMNFVADHAFEISWEDRTIAGVLFEIGLQRLSCGAVLHEPTSWPEPLPKQYWDYSSKWDESHVMTQGCYNFIMKAMETCLENSDTKDHALKILFGLLKHISPNGEVSHNYYALGEFKSKSVELYVHARRLVEKYAYFGELYANYAQPGQWQKHKLWFSDNIKKLNWNKFFADTQCLEGNFVARWRQKRHIKKELKKLSLPVAR